MCLRHLVFVHSLCERGVTDQGGIYVLAHLRVLLAADNETDRDVIA